MLKKKAQQNQGAKERRVNSSVELNGDQPPMMAQAQTKATTRFYEAFNGISAGSETEDMVAKLVKSSGQHLGEKFEERLKEIDMELGRFDKVRGVILGDNPEGENVGIKEQMTARKANESTPKSADRRAENSAGAKGFTQSRVHEANLVSVPITHTLRCVIFQMLWAL